MRYRTSVSLLRILSVAMPATYCRTHQVCEEASVLIATLRVLAWVVRVL